MPVWFPAEGTENDPEWWRALERVAQLTRSTAALPTIAACRTVSEVAREALERYLSK